MTNREIIDLKPGQLIATGKRARLKKIWQVEELFENNENALLASSIIRPGEIDPGIKSPHLPRTARERWWITLTWRNLKDYRRIA